MHYLVELENFKDRLKMRDMKQRHENAGVETVRNGNNGAM